MAHAICGSCGNNCFEMIEQSLNDASLKKSFIKCDACGVAIGISDYSDTKIQLTEIETKLKALEASLLTINNNLLVIANYLRS